MQSTLKIKYWLKFINYRKNQANMTTISRRSFVAAISGLLLTVPTCYFILISILKYVFGSPYLFDSIAPFLERSGIKEFPGWNINLLILFGPVLALLINLSVILRLHYENSRDFFDCRVTIYKKSWNLAVIVLAGVVLSILFVYALGENCNCGGR